MFIGKQVWDPWQICKQIAVLQLNFYAWLYILQVSFLVPFGGPANPLALFSSAMVGYGTVVGIMMSAAYLVNSCVAAVALRVVVARAKKCWDYGATMYIIHMLATCAYSGFPVSWVWWSIFSACMVGTILLGEYLCVQYEMADIPINTGNRGRRRDAQAQDIEAQVPLKIISAADHKLSRDFEN